MLSDRCIPLDPKDLGQGCRMKKDKAPPGARPDACVLQRQPDRPQPMPPTGSGQAPPPFALQTHTTALPPLPGQGSSGSRDMHVLSCRLRSQGLGDHFCPLGVTAGLGLRLGSWRASGGSPTADEDEFVGPGAATLFAFGSQGCDDALDVGIVGDGHHLGVGHGGVVNNLDPSWKLAGAGLCHLLGGLCWTRLLLGRGPLRRLL